MAPLIPSPRRSRLRRLAVLALGWCVLTSGVFSGCSGLFKPATPEPPTSKPIIPHYETVEQTLNTMELGIAAKAGGVDAWLGAFDPASYRQLFDERDLTDFGHDCQCDPPTVWGYTEEQNSYLSLMQVAPGDDYSAQFVRFDEKGTEPPPSPTGTILYRHYVIYANSSDGSSEVVAIGTVDLTLKEISGRWLITEWSDRRDSTATTDQLSMGFRRLNSTTQ